MDLLQDEQELYQFAGLERALPKNLPHLIAELTSGTIAFPPRKLHIRNIYQYKSSSKQFLCDQFE